MTRSAVRIRPVSPDDAERFADFVGHGLSAASRRLRFHGAVAGCSAAALAASVAPAAAGRAAWVAVAGGQIVGEARFVVVDADATTAEFAIAVADAWQGHGIAARLLQALADGARERDLRWLKGDVLAGNARMHALMTRLGFVTRAADWAGGPAAVACYERAVAAVWPSARPAARPLHAAVAAIGECLARAFRSSTSFGQPGSRPLLVKLAAQNA